MKTSTAKNNKSPWLPLALALAVNAAMPMAFAAEAIHIRAQPLGQALSELGQQTSLQVFFSPDLVAANRRRRWTVTFLRSRPCANCCKAAVWITRSMKVR